MSSADAALESATPQKRKWLDKYVAGLVVAGLLYAGAFIGLGVYKPVTQRIAGADPVGYYAWVHSLLFDHDLQFANEYRTLNAGATYTKGSLMNPDGARTETGHLPNLFSIGPGLLWTPFIGVAHGIALESGVSADGFTAPYHAAVFFANTFYGILGLVLTYLLLRTWFSQPQSAIGAFAAWACSPALYYTCAQIAMAHACSFFSVALFLLLWARLRLHTNVWAWIVVGLALGVAALVRWQNAAFALIPAIDLLWRLRWRGFAPLAVCGLASIVGFAPQMIAWKIVFGTFLTIPQGGGFVDWLHPDVRGTLFSRSSGLITWTPFCAVAMAGLCLWPKSNRVCWIALAAAFVAQLYINSVVPAAGWSFGMRRMVNCTPLFAVGMAQILTAAPWRMRWPVIVVSVLAVWNFLFVLQYGGFIDRFYVEQALRQRADELHVPVNELMQMKKLPGGEPFDIRHFAIEHWFPRGKDLTDRQLWVDKLVVIRFLLERMSPAATTSTPTP